MPSPGDQTYKLHKLDDRSLYELAEELREHLGITDPLRIRILSGYEFTPEQLPEEAISVGKYQILQIVLTGIISEVGSSIRGGATIQRHVPNNPEIVDREFDYVSLHLGNEFGAWSSNVPKLLKTIEIITSRDLTVIPESTDGSELLRSLILSQESAHNRMLSELNKSLVDLARQRKLFEEHKVQYWEEQAKDNERIQKQFDEQRAALERQSYMATRRKIGQSIHRIMTDPSHQASRNQAQRSRFSLAIFFAYFGLGVAGGFSTYFSFMYFSQISQGPSVTSIELFFVAKFLLSSAVTIFGFVSAANWMRRHLDTEIRLSEEKIAFIADIERASWVIEAMHEVTHEANTELPKEWVEAVTRNLFSARHIGSELDEGASALRALIGLAGSAKVGPQGLEMEFNKKGTKALGDAGE